MNKLVELYKESSEEWSKKAGELEGVIKALEVKIYSTIVIIFILYYLYWVSVVIVVYVLSCRHI